MFKPSPFAPLTAAKVAEIIASEFPAGVINVVHGDADVGVASYRECRCEIECRL
ncbi:aldehyde dehydrogenase family protein [Paenibacillus sp. 7516]|uniref:aldehyde dehydrogenase family protein n=1 Tax=Paenibacillus sp. 7516 TaxID=2022549 RepID=UPI0032C4881B